MIFDFYTILILCFAGGFVLWYSMVMGYMYPKIGNSDDFPSYINGMGIILGVAMLGCIALAAGITTLSILWLDLDTTSILTVVIAILAFGASVSALSIASIMH
jgi:hypothetical protein